MKSPPPARAADKKNKSASAVSPTEPKIQIKPHRGLFVTLLLIFLIWMGFLVTLYFTTVWHKTDVHAEDKIQIGQ